MISTGRYRIKDTRPGVPAAFVFAVILLVATPAQAQTFTVLHNFTGSPDGANPYGGLVRDKAGNLYGTTAGGGSYNGGTVFKLDKNGTETVLYNFTGSSDGSHPFGGLILDEAANLYGTTEDGGSTSCDGGCGVVFKVDRSGTETVLHSFAGGTTDGCYPYAGLVGNQKSGLYGTTVQCGAFGHGTVFHVDTSGRETLLYSFTGGPDGANPYGGLVQDAKGNLYGVTNDGGLGLGVVYVLSKNGTATVLYSFTGGKTDGCYPYGNVTIGNGTLYGTTNMCGSSNDGIVWKLSKKGETVLHNFAGGSSDGSNPQAGVIMDAMGNLYGETVTGGFGGVGTVYELSQEGVLTLLHMFSRSGSDGEYPIGGLIQDAEGNLYGVAYDGGSGSYGTAWTLTP